ncbi:MAG: ubiquitin-like small modifier protein 1 [Planctomycetota bacterium]
MSRLVTVRIPTPLRRYTAGADEVTARGETVGDVLRHLTDRHEGLRQHVLDGDGRVRTFVNIFVEDQDVRALQGLDSPVSDGTVISIIPAVAGGAGSMATERRLAELRRGIPEVTPTEAFRLSREGVALIDVREPEEVAAGSPPGAVRIVRGYLELRIEEVVPDLGETILVMCGGGQRSLLAADDLRRLGYRDVRSVMGGFNEWKNEGLPVEIPRSLGPEQRERYARHLLIPEVGEEGQLKLLGSRVLLVGAGGLGSPAALYLAAAGVGTIGIVDDDVVDRSNLQRQILHTDERVGTPKVDSARSTLEALNPETRVITHGVRLTSANVEEIFSRYEVIVDGADNFPTRRPETAWGTG